KRRKRWSEIEVDPDTQRAYEELVGKLLECNHRGGDGEPHQVKLTPAAFTRWRIWYDHWSDRQHEAGGCLGAAYRKIEAAAGRLALVHHICTAIAAGDDDLAPVELESMAAGIGLAEWFAREARRLYGTIAESDAQQEQRRLLEWLRRHEKTTTRKLQQSY